MAGAQLNLQYPPTVDNCTSGKDLLVVAGSIVNSDFAGIIPEQISRRMLSFASTSRLSVEATNITGCGRPSALVLDHPGPSGSRQSGYHPSQRHIWLRYLGLCSPSEIRALATALSESWSTREVIDMTWNWA
jgi:hypothetical protein